MSSARKRAYKHKAYAEIDSLKQELMLSKYHYGSMCIINRALAEKCDVMLAELLRVKEICLRECGIGIVNEVVIANVKGTP